MRASFWIIARSVSERPRRSNVMSPWTGTIFSMICLWKSSADANWALSVSKILLPKTSFSTRSCNVFVPEILTKRYTLNVYKKKQVSVFALHPRFPSLSWFGCRVLLGDLGEGPQQLLEDGFTDKAGSSGQEDNSVVGIEFLGLGWSVFVLWRHSDLCLRGRSEEKR